MSDLKGRKGPLTYRSDTLCVSYNGESQFALRTSLFSIPISKLHVVFYFGTPAKRHNLIS